MAIQRMGDKWIRRVQEAHPNVEVFSVWHRGGSGHEVLRVYGRDEHGRKEIWWYNRKTGALESWGVPVYQGDD